MEPLRPNVLMIVLDDLGFSDLGCFGSSIATPNLDRLASEGLRYTNFHTTPLCSPSRACFLTGRNHHSVHWGFNIPREGEGYDGRIPSSAATVARVLKDAGYRTTALGKWDQAWALDLPLGEAGYLSCTDRDGSGVAPNPQWPLGMGFDRFYGFLCGKTDQFTPNLVEDDRLIEPPASPEEGYHLTEDLADHAIAEIDAAGADPFFIYLATGAVHAPHQPPRSWVDRYRGDFDHGWDVERERRYARQVAEGIIPSGTVLTDRSPLVPAWDDLSDVERLVFGRQMELFAAFVSHTDAQLGRVLDHLAARGIGEDTLVILVSDNGAAGETRNGFLDWAGYVGDGDVEGAAGRLDDFGTPGTANHYASGWAWTGSTPLRMWKLYTWLGGVRVPLIVRGSRAVPDSERGTFRRQFVHAIDLMPTILDEAGVAPPRAVDGIEQQPIEGASIAATFADPAAPAPRSTQYFEMAGSRSIYHRGWKATTDHVPEKHSHAAGPPGWRLVGSVDFDEDHWSLFDLDADFSEAHDLAAEEPERLAELIAVWQREAERYHVLPLDDRPSDPDPH